MAEPKPLASLSAGLLARKGAARPAMRRQGQALDHNQNPLSGHEDLGWNDMGYDVDPLDHAAEIGRAAGHGLSPMSGASTHSAAPFNDAATFHASGYEPAAHQPSALEALGQAVDRVMALPADLSNHNESATVQSFDRQRDIPEQAAPPAVHHQQQRIEQALAPVEPLPAETLRPETPLVEAAVVAQPSTPTPPAPAVVPAATIAPASPTPRRRERAGTRGNFAFTLRLDPSRHLRLRLASATTNRSAQQIIIALVDDYLSNLPEIDAFAAQMPASMSAR